MGKPKASAPSASFTPTSLPSAHIMVKLGPPRGAGSFDSQDAAGSEHLVELGSKLKRSGALATRGDYAIVSLYPSDPSGKEKGKGNKMAGEVVQVYTEKEVRAFKKGGEWPSEFEEPAAPVRIQRSPSPGEDSDEEFERKDTPENEQAN